MFDAGGSRDDGTGELVAALVDTAGQSLSALAGVDLSSLSDDQLRDVVRGLEAMRRSLDAAEGHALVELDDRGDATRAAVGLATSKWLARDAHLPPWVARQRLSTALQLREFLPEVDAALVHGRIGFDHARVFAEVVNERNADAFGLVAPDLIAAAATTAFRKWRRRVREIAADLDFDGPHDPADDILRNKLTLSPSDGFVLLRGELVGDAAVIAQQALEDRTDQLYRRYSRDRERFGDGEIACRATLRALALVELLRQALGVDTDGSKAPRTDATIVIHPGTAADDPGSPRTTLEADDGPVITTPEGRRLPKRAAGLLVCASLFQVLLSTASSTGVPIAETDAYQPSRAIRRALQRRDGACVFPGCDAKVTWTDAHHIVPWPEGPTALSNLILVCRTHHRHLHHLGWSVELDEDGWTRWTSPTGTSRWGQRHQQTRAGP